MAGNRYEKMVAAEWLVVMFIITADAMAHSSAKKFKLPNPSRYFATMVVYLFLAAACLFGTGPGRVAAGFGGLAALAITLAPPNLKKPPNTTTNAPVVLSALNWLSTMMKHPPGTLTTAGAGKLPGGTTLTTGTKYTASKLKTGVAGQGKGSSSRVRTRTGANTPNPSYQT